MQKPKRNLPGMIVVIFVTILVAWILLAPYLFSFRINDNSARKAFAKNGLVLDTVTQIIQGRKIHYVMVGDKSLPTLAFFHGSPSSWTAFIDYMKDPELLKHYRMVGVDRPGFGYSDFGQALNLQQQAAYLMPVFDKIKNNRPVYLAGHSLGAPLLIEMAANRPDYFTGILLISGSVAAAFEPKEKWRYLMQKFPFHNLFPGSFKTSNTELLYFKKDVVNLTQAFEKITCAVYFVHGEKDSWVPVGNVDYAVEKLTHASKIEKLILPGGNHFIPWTRRKEITAELIRMSK